MLNVCYLRTSELTKNRFVYALLFKKAGVHIFLTNIYTIYIISVFNFTFLLKKELY